MLIRSESGRHKPWKLVQTDMALSELTSTGVPKEQSTQLGARDSVEPPTPTQQLEPSKVNTSSRKGPFQPYRGSSSLTAQHPTEMQAAMEASWSIVSSTLTTWV